jgi:adenine/guanine phosphoribosyltransferase-like PRPP-binding protein
MIMNVVFDTILISDDWIALTQSMEAVLQFMKRNGAVSKKVQLRIQELSKDSRKTVSRKALKLTTLMEV